MDRSLSSAPSGITDEPTDLTGSKTGNLDDDQALEVPPYALEFQPEHWP